MEEEKSKLDLRLLGNVGYRLLEADGTVESPFKHFFLTKEEAACSEERVNRQILAREISRKIMKEVLHDLIMKGAIATIEDIKKGRGDA